MKMLLPGGGDFQYLHSTNIQSLRFITFLKLQFKKLHETLLGVLGTERI